MEKSSINNIQFWVNTIIETSVLSTFKALFQADSSKIVSTSGRLILENQAKMEKVEKAIEKLDENNQFNEVLVDLE